MNLKTKILIITLIVLVLYSGAVLGQLWYYNNNFVGFIIEKSADGSSENTNEKILSTLENPLILTSEDHKFKTNLSDRKEWIERYTREYTGQTEYRYKIDAIIKYVSTLAPAVNQLPENGKFTVKNGEIKESVPSKNGKSLNEFESAQNIIRALISSEGEAELSIKNIEPAITLDYLNSLGINTLLSKGTSDFAGSIPSRVHNITVGATKLSSIIIAPGEEFSFNNTVGDTGFAEGYQSGLVIKGNKLVPEYGGGICQVSTTLFRAAVEAGLKITERQSHSLPVRYYDPQGYDSTIYQGVVDLKFINNTPSYILIQSSIDGTKIAFEVYGKNDGRKVSVNKPITYSTAEDGSFKTVFTQTIEKPDGTVDNNKFYSSYKSPTQFEVIRNPLE